MKSEECNSCSDNYMVYQMLLVPLPRMHYVHLSIKLTKSCTLKSFARHITFNRSQDSVFGIVTGYGLDDREFGVRVPVGSRIFTSPCRLDRPWGPPNLVFSGYRENFPGGKAAGA
jgi:hypothetical protein